MSRVVGWALVAPRKSLHDILTADTRRPPSRLIANGGGHAVGLQVGDC